jgi:putative isomerase
MAELQIPLARAWNSWNGEYPAQISFPPLGLSITPCAYAASRAAFTRFAGRDGARLLSHDLAGSVIDLELAHAGSEIAWRYRKVEDFAVCGEWRTLKLAEWGLRFWLLLCVELSPPGGEGIDWRLDEATGDLVAAAGSRHVVVRGERRPLLVSFHDSIAALEQELGEKGYFYRGSRGTKGRVAVLRYQLDEMPRFRFAAAIRDRQDLAAGAVTAALATPAAEGAALHDGRFAGALDAVRDVMAWNQVWDPVGRRPYITDSRNWLGPKFGQFCLWASGTFYHAMMAGLFDLGVARETLQALFAHATPAGNFPALATDRDIWVDRSHPPVGAFILWMLYQRSGSRELLAQAYKPLLANHDWWWQARDGNQNGLLEHGTSPLGESFYVGTKMAAKDDSSMDNSPVHDEATLDAKAGTLDCEDVGLNSLVALDAEMLALIAGVLGDHATAERLTGLVNRLRQKIADRLWDSERATFANRLWSGSFVRALAPTSFFPLLCGAASADQARAMLRLLEDPAKFGGAWLLPSVARDDPSYRDNVYWRGRIWPPLSFLVYHGLRRYGFEAAATRLAENAYAMFNAEWGQRRCPENYNADTGAALDQPDTDGFYSWGALIPALAVAEICDVNPWNGWELAHDPAQPVKLGPVATPAGAATIETARGWLTLALDGRPRLRTDLIGRLRHLHLAADRIALVMPPVPDGGAVLELQGVAGRDVLLCLVGNRVHEPLATGEGVRITLPAAAEPTNFVLLLRTAPARLRRG